MSDQRRVTSPLLEQTKEKNSLVATAVKKMTSGHMSLMTVALNFFRLQPVKSGFCATILNRLEATYMRLKRVLRRCRVSGRLKAGE